MKKLLFLLAISLTCATSFAQVPAVSATTKWQAFDGNSVWVPSALDFKSYVLLGLDGLAPSGGADGQVLTKQSSTNYDYAWETPSGGGGASYSVYTALISQSGSDAPTATVLENTLGSIVWEYLAVGKYVGTLTGAFVTDKTWTSVQNSGASGSIISSLLHVDNSRVWLYSFDGGSLSDDILYLVPIEIRVYP